MAMPVTMFMTVPAAVISRRAIIVAEVFNVAMAVAICSMATILRLGSTLICQVPFENQCTLILVFLGTC